ncbi:DUF2309 domain-containing protein [Mammaliicoccus sciuri]|uniref:DUF2309 domain-containing protein n=1 Tax=Mammaliicoccus sciuri TaxID=1296 RepID=UPI0037BBF329
MTQTIESINDITYSIKEASRVITPLSPINIFAARHPWAGLEDRTFEDVARWFQKVQNVDLYPIKSFLFAAIENGEIKQEYIEERLSAWLSNDNTPLNKEMLREYAESILFNRTHKVNLTEQDLQQLRRSIENVALNKQQDDDIIITTRIEQYSGQAYLDKLNAQVIKWSKLYLDDNQSGWAIHKDGKGFYKNWKRLAHLDPALSKAERRKIKMLPSTSIETIESCLDKLGISEAQVQSYLEIHLLTLPGWAGMMLWKDERLNLLTDYLAIRLALERTLMSEHAQEQQHTEQDISQVRSWFETGILTLENWFALSQGEREDYIAFAHQFDRITQHKLLLEAWEDTYEAQLQSEIQSHIHHEDDKAPVEAQLAFCIDTRSEPFRRQLEMEGPFETIGIAGFFGLPIEKCELGHQHTHNALPVMNKPQHKIYEYEDAHQSNHYVEKKKSVSSIFYTFKKMKQNVLPSLLLPELTGSWLSVQTIARSFMPKRTGDLVNRFNKNLMNKPETKLSIDHAPNRFGDLPIGFTKQEQLTYAREALKLMDLTEDFAPLVVICGHGSHSANNPYAASLDCGACGGSASGFNAKVLATLCNLPEVREGLISNHIIIPEDTVFVAAEHSTTTDQLEWLYVPQLSNKAEHALQKLKLALPKAGHEANRLRLKDIPGMEHSNEQSTTKAEQLASDWSEIRPEWGLARNATFVIGKRTLTEQSQLNGRAFLHNYDWTKDHDGEILNTILSGPATVAQWINLQYYASTVAPYYYGSGNKITQTVTSGIGVMQGNGSDLLTGLPWQSVMKADGEYYHAPIRLLVVIQAPNDYIRKLLNENTALNTKVKNDWLLLSSIDENGEWHKW